MTRRWLGGMIGAAAMLVGTGGEAVGQWAGGGQVYVEQPGGSGLVYGPGQPGPGGLIQTVARRVNPFANRRPLGSIAFAPTVYRQPGAGQAGFRQPAMAPVGYRPYAPGYSVVPTGPGLAPAAAAPKPGCTSCGY